MTYLVNYIMNSTINKIEPKDGQEELVFVGVVKCRQSKGTSTSFTVTIPRQAVKILDLKEGMWLSVYVDPESKAIIYVPIELPLVSKQVKNSESENSS